MIHINPFPYLFICSLDGKTEGRSENRMSSKRWRFVTYRFFAEQIEINYILLFFSICDFYSKR